MTGAVGLTRVPTDTLVHLLRLVHRGELPCPLDRPDLVRFGFQAAADDLGPLRGLDGAGVRAVLVCVLAERQPR